ncbi:hypothetical protein Mal52_08100 [Symmachiella dynata]|uniref:Uncharacterized protein n=1 Tax=Symmachiella dynata TaxID=2527995 RepID=A0A517ZIQ5_9PLAN|nr:hypothetical protein Mal52_08100 [Symmachiella dynata]
MRWMNCRADPDNLGSSCHTGEELAVRCVRHARPRLTTSLAISLQSSSATAALKPFLAGKSGQLPVEAVTENLRN